MISKSKFVLTTDLVKVEPEPVEIDNTGNHNLREHSSSLIDSEKKKKPSAKKGDRTEGDGEKDQLSLKIDRAIKRRFQVWCVQNQKTMTQAIEDAINLYTEK